MINSKEKPANYPVYVVHSDIDSFVLFNLGCPDDGGLVSNIEEERDNSQEKENIHDDSE